MATTTRDVAEVAHSSDVDAFGDAATPANLVDRIESIMPPEDCANPATLDITNDAETPASTGPKHDGDGDDLIGELAFDQDLDPVAEMEAQLEREMVKRRPDRFLVTVICRSLGGVPQRFRSTIWKELLGVARSERLHLDQSISRVEEDLANQKVIAADACRTRGNDAFFKQRETVETIVKILTFYSKSRNIRYKQGMNEVLAPFLMLERDPPLAEGVVFQLFYAMIDKFLPHVFVDREFKSLQCSFQLFRLLMLYHDPVLCNYLDQHAMTPELYVTPWFMTLFARGLSQELVLVLWDFFILQEDPYLLHFVAYALVESNRDKIMSADVSMLPQVLSNIAMDTREQVDTICSAALQLMDTTPLSFRRDLYSVCYGGYNDAMIPFLRQLMGASSLQVYPDELVANLLSRLGQANGASPATIAGSIPPPTPAELIAQKSFSAERHASMSSVFFIVLDCRPIEQYRECHLSLSYHIDPEIVGSPDALSVLIKGFTRMKGCHFCFVGPSIISSSTAKSGGAFDAITKLTRGISGDRDVVAAVNNTANPGVGNNTVPALKKEHITVTRLVLMFLQKGFEHVSRLDGGFDELKREIESMEPFVQEQLLVTEDPVTLGAQGDTGSNGASAGGFKLFARKALDKVRTMSDDDPTSAIVTTGVTTEATAVTNIKAKTKATVTNLSMKLQIFTSAAKDAVTAGRALQSPPPNGAVAEERRLVGEEEWLEVCVRTKEALEKSLCFKDVVFQVGSLGILFQRSRHKKYLTVVDSLVPESQASDSQQIETGDLLISVNGQDIAGIPFQDVIEIIKDAQRPLMLRFQNPKKKSLDSFDAISIPPLPPILISASHHSICVSWTKLSTVNARYQLQYAKQSDYNFNPWVSVPMKQENLSAIDGSGITTFSNGTMVGLDPGVSLVFRVRCGNGEKWGPYSLSSGSMSTLDKGLDEASRSTVEGTPSPSFVPEQRARGVSSPTARTSSAVFLPGECPEFFERGVFYFRVIAGLKARLKPEFNSEKLDIVLEKGTIVKCSERLVAPGTSQIFVRLCRDWNISCRRHRSAKLDGEDAQEGESANDDFDAWAFENTAEGAMVLERLPEFSEEMYAPPPVPLQEQAKSLVSSIFTASGIKPSASTSATASLTATNGAGLSALTPPMPSTRVVETFAPSPTEVVLSWAAIDDSRISKYQIQYAKNRLTAMWSVKQDVGLDSVKFVVTDLAPNTSYVFRVRGGNEECWGPFSEPSDACKTLEEPARSSQAVTPQKMPKTTEERDMVDAAASIGDTRSSTFTSFFGRATSSPVRSASAPLRTGSTFLDKAVAAASKLTLSRHTSSADAIVLDSDIVGHVSDTAAEQYIEPSLLVEGDLVDVSAWKAELAILDPCSRSFQAVRYIPTLAVAATNAIDLPQTSKRGVSSSSSSTDEPVPSNESPLLTWNRVGERELVITDGSLFALAKPSSQTDASDAVIETQRSLSALAKITSKKTVPNSVVFHFKREITEMEIRTQCASAAEALEQLCFVVEDKAACVALVKQNYAPDV